MVVFTLIGPPGVGKGTLAAAMHERFQLLHLSTGQIIRQHVREDSAEGREFAAHVHAGDLVPDSLVDQLVSQHLDALPADTPGILFDGYPRTLPQAEHLDHSLANRDRYHFTAAIGLEADDDTLLDRISGRRICPDCGRTYHIVSAKPLHDGQCDACGAQLQQRDDDQPHTVADRLRVYAEQTRPILAHYQRQHRLRRLDATGTSEANTAALAALLGSYL